MCIAFANNKQNFRILRNGLIAEVYHLAIFHSALRNPNSWIFSLHLMYRLIFEYPPGQNLQ